MPVAPVGPEKPASVHGLHRGRNHTGRERDAGGVPQRQCQSEPHDEGTRSAKNVSTLFAVKALISL